MTFSSHMTQDQPEASAIWHVLPPSGAPALLTSISVSLKACRQRLHNNSYPAQAHFSSSRAYPILPVIADAHICAVHIADVDLGAALMANVQRCKYTKPTPVQRYSIPIGLAGRDLMACAQTGSGKTAAFCFPIIANILRAGTPPAPRARKASAGGPAHAHWLTSS